MTNTTSSGGALSSSGSSPMRDEFADDANRLKETAAKRAGEEAGKRKEQATSAAHSASSAISKAAEELRKDDSTPSWLASAFEATARQVEELARTVEGKDVGEIRRELSNFARRSPAAFLGASAIAGFAAARVLRAGSEHKSHEQTEQGGHANNSLQPYEPTTAGGSKSVWPGKQASAVQGREGAIL